MFRRFLGLHSDRRHDRRFDADGGWLICQGQRLPLLDLSLSGLRVHHAPSLVRPGDLVDFTLDLPMAVRTLSVHGRARVVRVEKDGFALAYTDLDQRLMRVLHFYLGGCRPLGGPLH